MSQVQVLSLRPERVFVTDLRTLFFCSSPLRTLVPTQQNRLLLNIFENRPQKDAFLLPRKYRANRRQNTRRRSKRTVRHKSLRVVSRTPLHLSWQGFFRKNRSDGSMRNYGRLPHGKPTFFRSKRQNKPFRFCSSIFILCRRQKIAFLGRPQNCGRPNTF